MQIGIPETLAATGQETGWCWGAPGIHREWADWALVRALGGFLAVGEDWGLTRDVVEWGGFFGDLDETMRLFFLYSAPKEIDKYT